MSSSFDTSLTKISISSESVYSNGAIQGVQTQREGSLPVTRIGKLQDAQDLQPYQVTISEEALRKAGLLKDQPPTGKTGAPAENNPNNENSNSFVGNQENRELENLKRLDRQVRAHEQAHVIAGGSLVRGAASFGYVTGSDGRLYAVRGEVSIDSSPVQDDPAATIRKMVQVVKAALSPAQPSGQDRAVATAATRIQTEAQQQVTQEQMKKMQGSSDESEQFASTGAPDSKKSNTETRPVESPDAISDAPQAENQPDIQKPASLQSKHINIQA